MNILKFLHVSVRGDEVYIKFQFIWVISFIHFIFLLAQEKSNGKQSMVNPFFTCQKKYICCEEKSPSLDATDTKEELIINIEMLLFTAS